MNHKLNLSRNLGSIKSTSLEAWTPTFSELCRAFSTPKIDTDKLNAGYFLRCAGTKRGNETVGDTASLLILDGDSRIDDNGEIIAGAVNPMQIHLVLNHLKTDHFIYTSHSNNVGLWKYRVLIPCEYTRQQLPILLDWLFERLHENDAMLANVKENSSWAQAWFLSCVHPDRANLFKTWWRVGGKESHPIADFELAPSECFWAERIVREHESRKPVNESIPTVARVPMTNLSANPIEAFDASFSVHDVLIRNGYKQNRANGIYTPTAQAK
jgi:hypothetical protein